MGIREAGLWPALDRESGLPACAAVRAIEFADHCDDLWGRELPGPYPPFEKWRKEADAFVDLD